MNKFLRNLYLYFFNPIEKIKIRIKLYLYFKEKNKFLCHIYYSKLILNHNIYISKNANFGKNIVFPHPQNIVVGNGVTIQDNCKIYHDVTIGQNKGLYPFIGNNVIIYSGAKIIGNVTIGEYSIIGANSVVTKNIPSFSIVAGIPGKVIAQNNEKEFY